MNRLPNASAPLLDTQLLLWLAAAPEHLPPALAKDLEDRKDPFCFSLASLWEVAIKTSLVKAGFAVDAGQLRVGLLRGGFQELAIEAEHCLAVQHLPWVHRDPFDRLLVAQAISSERTLLTTDRTLEQYGPAVRWVGGKEN